MENSLNGFQDSLALSNNYKAKLKNLTQWLSTRRTKFDDEWSHEELLNALVSDKDSGAETVLQEARDKLRAMQGFANVLVERPRHFERH